ncbi:pseudaminic acid cytidylyltransferase [Campylobacter sp.]|uniref:pseudaminic acid cytidylyltransferase n=1 Tax=Campylobacter sp. TaxID=205 RepID=UPI0026DC39F7|nr:pseudaminic acid cytidylyltransferase [Campylobacter sp.]MDO4674197.1 pseudaminic acid cytidylyltransferase [Campylobacter sp.]
MSALCLIPARGGSKRIPRKNIIPFCGKPLIAHSIGNALNSGIFDAVVVSSDDEEIIAVARTYGATVPFVRPQNLSDDFASSTEVVRHAITTLAEAGQHYELVCCLYATAPLVDAGILREAFAEFKRGGAEFLFSAAEFSAPIQRAFYLDEERRVRMFDEGQYFSRSQDLTPAFFDAGAFYFGKSRAWMEGGVMFRPHAAAFVLGRNLVCDIDTPQDLEWAKILYQNKEEQCLLKK